MSNRVCSRLAPPAVFSLAPAVLAALVLAWTPSAQADRFDAAAKGAARLEGSKALGALFWSDEAQCSKEKGDFRKRQCRGVRDARRAKVANRTFLVDVGGPAIDVSSKPSTMSAQISLRACIACEADGPVVVGKGVHKVNGGRIVATPLETKTKVFKKASQLSHWEEHVGSRLRGQFLVKLSTPTERFKVGTRQGYKLSVVGYRFYDPCDGSVIASKPSSKKGPTKSDYCKDMPAAPSEDTEPKKPVIVHPDRLSTQQIKTAMVEAQSLAKKCHEAYGIDGMATFKLVIAGSGKLTRADQSGDFEGTPTGICLDKAIKVAVFPQSKKKATPITYPMMLR